MTNKTYKNNVLELSRLGLGCMRLSLSRKSIFKRSQSIATIQNALDSGINFLNTGTFYGFFNHNLKLIGEAIKGYNREDVFISLKYGNFTPMAFLGADVKVGPKYAREYLMKSLKHLGVDYIDLYQPARVDSGIPIEETMGALKKLVDEGLVKHIGLSEVDAETLRKAQAIHPVSLVEMAYSITNKSIEAEVLPTARELGIGVVAFGIMGFGKLLKQEGDPLTDTLHEITKEKNISMSQLAHAWILAKGDDIIPLMGARTVSQLEDTLKSLNINLSEQDILRIETSMKESKVVGQSMPKFVIKNGVVQR